MTREQRTVERWMRKAGLDFPRYPETRSPEDRKVCARLLFEECLETIEALGVNAMIDWQTIIIDNVTFSAESDPDLIKLADGLGDVKYVANYTATKHGIDLERVEEEISRSNDSKFLWTREQLEDAAEKGWTVKQINSAEYCVTDQSGKIRKPVTYSPANIAPILYQQSEAGQAELPTLEDIQAIYAAPPSSP